MYQRPVSTRPPVRTAALLIATVLLLAGCGENSGAGAINLAPNQSLTLPIARDLGVLDPALAQGEAELAVIANVFDGVVSAAHPGGEVQPDLATALPDVSADGRTYTFHLRPGAHFSNGDALTAADVIYSWSRCAALHGPDSAIFAAVNGYAATVAAGAAAKPLSGLAAIDDHTLEVKLSAPASYFLDRLASAGAAVVDRKVVATLTDPLGRSGDWASQPASQVGTGAFHMTGRVAGASIDFGPVSDWWGDPKPVLHLLHVQVARDASDPLTGYLAGTYDLVGYAGMEHLALDALTRVRQSSAASDLSTVPRAATTWIGFNYKLGPFAGSTNGAAQLRRAFSLAIDRKLLGDTLCHASGTCIAATGGLVAPGVRGYAGQGSDSLAGFDASQAKALLKKADPNGTITGGLIIDFADTPENGALFQFLQDRWQKVLGVKVERRTGNPQTPAGSAPSPLFIQRWQARYDDPRDLYTGYFAGKGAANVGGFDSDTVDNLIVRADAQGADESLVTYGTVAEKLQAEAAYIPAYYDSANLVVKPRVVGASMGALFDGPWSKLQVLQ